MRRIPKHLIYLTLGLLLMNVQVLIGFKNNDFKTAAYYTSFITIAVAFIAVIKCIQKKLKYVPLLLVISLVIGLISVIFKLI